MRFLKGFVPNFTIVLSIAFLVLVYLDGRNEHMRFLNGTLFQIFAFIYAVCSIFSALMMYISWRKSDSRRGKYQANRKINIPNVHEIEK